MGRPIPKRVFRAVALATLPAPFIATWLAAPSVLRAVGDPAGAARVLVAVLTLLVAVVGWAVALLPLRRRSDMPAMGLGDATSLAAAMDRARAEHEALANAGDDRPELQRRFHFRMAAGGGIVALVGAVVTYAMAIDPAGRMPLVFPVATAVGGALGMYHLVRAFLR